MQLNDCIITVIEYELVIAVLEYKPLQPPM